MAALSDIVFVGVDIGSVNRPGGFSWVSLHPDGGTNDGQDDPAALAKEVAAQLAGGALVAVAFESPLSVPVSSSRLGRPADAGSPMEEPGPKL